MLSVSTFHQGRGQSGRWLGILKTEVLLLQTKDTLSPCPLSPLVCFPEMTVITHEPWSRVVKFNLVLSEVLGMSNGLAPSWYRNQQSVSFLWVGWHLRSNPSSLSGDLALPLVAVQGSWHFLQCYAHWSYQRGHLQHHSGSPERSPETKGAGGGGHSWQYW